MEELEKIPKELKGSATLWVEQPGSGSFRIHDLVFHIRKGRQVFAEHFLLIICNNDETSVRILPEQMEQHGQILYRKQCFRLVLCQMPQSCAFPS